MTTERLQVVSTRMNCRTLEQRLKSVQNGFSLLKCKSDALQIRCREIDAQIKEKKHITESMFKDAFQRLLLAEFHGANLQAFSKTCSETHSWLSCELETVCGCTLVNFKVHNQKFDKEIIWEFGDYLKEIKEKFDGLLCFLAETTSLENQLKVARSMFEMTNKRKNALEHNLIPKLENTVNYIKNELDEMEREDFYRLKKVQAISHERKQYE